MLRAVWSVVFLSTPHRTPRTLHTQYFVWHKTTLWREVCSLKIIVCRSRALCLIRTRRGLIFHLFHFLNASPLYFYHLTVMNNHLIHVQNGLVVWPHKVRLQVMSPTPLLRSAVQRLLPFIYHQSWQASAQQWILERTPQIQLVCSEVDKRLSIGRVASPLLCRREKQVQSLQEFITPLEVHPTFEARETCRKKRTQTEIEQRPKKLTGDNEREKRLSTASERNGLDNKSSRSLKNTSRWSSRGEKTILLRLSEAEFHSKLLLEEQRNQILSEARSEIHMQKLKGRKSSASWTDKFILIVWRVYQANQVFENSRWEQARLQAELENREGTHHSYENSSRSGRIE